MPQHTPGPWKIAFGGTPQDDYAVIGSPHSDRAICNLEPRDYNPANASLIAAAPALLEALERIVEKYNASPDVPLGCGLVNGDFFAARAAIAAARGEGVTE